MLFRLNQLFWRANGEINDLRTSLVYSTPGGIKGFVNYA